MSNKLTHIDQEGNPTMVDVSEKSETHRSAKASSKVILPEAVMQELQKNDFNGKKGSIIHTSIISGIMAAKKTSELIPFCHQINLSDCKVNIQPHGNELHITCEAKTVGKTGVEMEALTGASVAALTIYDMCKALSHHITIQETRLLKKQGGKSDFSIT